MMVWYGGIMGPSLVWIAMQIKAISDQPGGTQLILGGRDVTDTCC